MKAGPPSMVSEPALQFEAVSKAMERGMLSSGSTCRSLRGIRCLSGPSGCGKTTLLALCGPYRRRKGACCWLARPLSPARRPQWSSSPFAFFLGRRPGTTSPSHCRTLTPPAGGHARRFWTSGFRVSRKFIRGAIGRHEATAGAGARPCARTRYPAHGRTLCQPRCAGA